MTSARYGSTGYRGGFRPRATAPAGERPRPRQAWLTMLDFALASFGAPSEPPYDLANSLRGLSADSFPVGKGDIRARWAKRFLDGARLWIDSAATRTAFAPGLTVEAAALKDFLIDQGAAMAVAGRERIGLED